MQLDIIYLNFRFFSIVTDSDSLELEEKKRFVQCVDAATQKTAHSSVLYHFFVKLCLFFPRSQRAH